MIRQHLRAGVVSAALATDPRDALRVSRALGFAGVQLDAYSAGLSLPELSGSGRRELRHLLASNNQELVSLRVETGADGFSPRADVDRQLTRIERAMEAAASLAAPLLCIDLGPLPALPTEQKPRPTIRPDEAGLIIIPSRLSAAPAPESTSLSSIPVPVDPNLFACVDAAMVELGRRADRYSVTLACRSELAGFAALERAMRTADCPWLGIDLDPVAILRDDWSMNEVFSRLGNLIRHVRGRDALKGADRRTKPAVMGQGSTDWQALLAALDDAHYHGWITIDPIELANRAAAATAGLKLL